MRKVIRLLESFSHKKSSDVSYLIDLCKIVIESSEERVMDATKEKAKALLDCVNKDSIDEFILGDLLFLLMKDFNIPLGDWDFVDEENELDISKRSVFPISVVLDRMRSPFNIGSIFRTSDSFALSHLYLTTPCADVDHPRTLRSAAGCTKSVPYTKGTPGEIIELIKDRPIFALELGGKEMSSFTFPSSGVMIVGSEELGVSPELLELAHNSLGVVSIPLFGTKGSLNVSSAFSIAMYNWITAIRR
ncbi:MAG: TrmH family RNA methyltransferase [Spirochaetia bacterium]|nr:TrmH family RNA methyltransferase [Spirochaetia bacterium]